MLYLVTTPAKALGRLLRGRHFLDLADLTVRGFDRAYLSGCRAGTDPPRIAILKDEEFDPLVQKFCTLARALELPPPEVLTDPRISGDCHLLVLHKEGKDLGVYYLAPDPFPTNGGATTNGGVAPSATNDSIPGAVW